MIAALLAVAAVATPATLTIDAPDRTPLTLDLAALAKLPQVSVSRTDHGKTLRCTGVPLTALLERIGQPQGDALRGAALASGIMVRARDGYRVLFSLGELDGSLGKAEAVLASSCDGQPLDAVAGPLRLLVAGDTRAARSVRQVTRISVVTPR